MRPQVARRISGQRHDPLGPSEPQGVADLVERTDKLASSARGLLGGQDPGVDCLTFAHRPRPRDRHAPGARGWSPSAVCRRLAAPLDCAPIPHAPPPALGLRQAHAGTCHSVVGLLTGSSAVGLLGFGAAQFLAPVGRDAINQAS